MKRLKLFLYVLAIFLVILGLTCKFMHWPGAAFLLILGAATSVAAFFLPPEGYKNKRHKDNILDDFE